MTRRPPDWPWRITAASLLLSALGVASAGTPHIIDPEAQPWLTPLGDDSIQAQWVLGAEDRPGNYLLRVKLAQGARIPPHTHPDTRNTTILEGSVWIGFGKTFDPDNMQRLDAGEVYEAPAGIAHYLWARDAAVIYQESGHGPSGMQFLPQSKN